MESLRSSFVNELINLSKSNSNIVVLDCDMGRHNQLNAFKESFEDRFYQIGISEQNAIGIAAGMAKGGLIPVVSSFAMFICGRAWEQIRHSVCYNNVNVNIFATHAGLSAGEDGGTHQCIEDFALMMALPNIEVFAPAFNFEIREICKYITNSNYPSYVRVGRDLIEYDLECDNYQVGDPIELGDVESDKIVISTGEITHEVLKAYGNSSNFKIVHIGSLRPLNVAKLRKTLKYAHKILVIEEHAKFGGLMGILSTLNVFPTNKISHLSMSGRFGQTGTVDELREFYGLSTNNILEILNQE